MILRSLFRLLAVLTHLCSLRHFFRPSTNQIHLMASSLLRLSGVRLPSEAPSASVWPAVESETRRRNQFSHFVVAASFTQYPKRLFVNRFIHLPKLQITSNTMLRLLTAVLLGSSFVSSTTSSPFTRGLGPSLFGVRGGGLFGGNKDGEQATEEASSGEKKLYPALSPEEIEDWMEHVPVFAVTDSNGAGIVLKPDDSTSVFYFFLNPLAANATLSQLKGASPDMDLKVSAFSLGKIWFKLLNADPDTEVTLKTPGGEDSDTTTAKGVEYRLVPDTRDLLGARMLLTMTPEDSEKLKTGEAMTPEMAQKAIEKAMTEAPKFKATFNEIPVFTIAQMRMQKQASAGDTDEPVTLLPMYFSLQNMVGTWQQFMSQAGPELQGVEPAINLMSLQDLVEMMQKESEIDFRHVVLVPPAPDAEGSTGSTTSADADPMANMGGATLGDV